MKTDMNRRLRDGKGELARRPTSLSIAADLLEAAKELNINMSRAAEVGIADAVSKARAEQWRRENKEAIESYNRWIEANGPPLEEYRMF